jgi:hypothetical protein
MAAGAADASGAGEKESEGEFVRCCGVVWDGFGMLWGSLCKLQAAFCVQALCKLCASCTSMQAVCKLSFASCVHAAYFASLVQEQHEA